MDPRWNRYADEAGLVPQLVPYVWDPDMRVLRQGATSMWISGHGHGFYPGQELLIDTAGVVSGDSPVREVVRVTGATESTDPVREQDVTRIHWADGLASDHDLTRTQVAGNLVPAMQGRIVQGVFVIPGDAEPSAGGPPARPVHVATVRADHAGSPPHCLYTLAGPVAWWSAPAPDGGPAQARPALALHAITASRLPRAGARPRVRGDGDLAVGTPAPRRRGHGTVLHHHAGTVLARASLGGLAPLLRLRRPGDDDPLR